MDDPHNHSQQTAEAKNILPDVVHSQQIPGVAAVVIDEVASGDTSEHVQDVEESQTESISEHIPSKAEYSTDDEEKSKELRVEVEQEKVSKAIPDIPITYSPTSDNASTQDPSKLSTSWPLEVNVSDVHHISAESPVNLALSSDLSKEVTQDKSQIESPKLSEHDSLHETPRSDYLDSLNEDRSPKSDLSRESPKPSNEQSPAKSSDSEGMIKLDIRGRAAPKFAFPTAKIIFGPPPEGSTIIEPEMKPIPVFPNLLSPFLVGSRDSHVEELYDDVPTKDISPEKYEDSSPKESLSDKIEQSDLLVEEISVEEELRKEKDDSLPPKSMPETISFSTMTTDYKTICEEYHGKLVHLEEAITQRDDLIEELTVSLQRSVEEQDHLRHENQHLTNEVQNLQHTIGEFSDDTIKAQLSDFIKYQTLLKDDSTKFYSALMSGGSSLRSSNSEKDNEREEITVNYSKSDLKSSDASGDFQTGFETKILTVINKFDEFIEENLRNKLRESLIQVLCDEIGKMRIDFDTEMKEMEAQLQQDKQSYSVETRKLRELLASVKAGSADIDVLRQELAIKHEKEMENLRTYFEKKCSDMERSYSEEVWRGKCVSPGLGVGAGVCVSVGGSLSSIEAEGAGDYIRRRTRSAELPSLSLELTSTPIEQAARLLGKKYEQQIEETRAENLAYINELQTKQRETILALEEQISQLKNHIQNSESVMYPQDIDLELEKKMEVQLEQRLEEVREQVRQDVVNHLQEQLQVLLSDPDAEVSSWPLELVALRDKIHGDSKNTQEKELSSLRDELTAGEDKWKHRRNISFDQNRHLEEVTKERDDLKRVAVSLHGAVTQLVAYCASAEDELNRTVLAQLLPRLLLLESADTSKEDVDILCPSEESRPESPNLTLELSNLSRGKHVHFAPDLNSILDLDEDGIVGFLQHQRDLSADIKRELEHSLRRLRHEAHSLLDLSEKLSHKNRDESNMLESSVHITELVQACDQRSCDNCLLHRKNMEDAMSECLQRENLLRSDLEAAMIKIAQLMSSADVIAEGYGTGALQMSHSTQRPPRRSTSEPAPTSPSPSPHSSPSLSPPGGVDMQLDIDTLQKERDDLQQQLEAANRQLRSTRQFVEEQATEREIERDEFTNLLTELRDENTRLSTRLQNNARILSEVEQLEAQTREMNQIITELETRKAATDDDLKANEEKVILLRDIIANLENQLEQKCSHEKEILEQLETMKNTIEERDSKMRSLLGELESLRNERVEQSDVTCVTCGQEEDKCSELLEKIKEQTRYIEDVLVRRARKLERVHEVCSISYSEPSEDLSLRDQRDTHLEASSPEAVTPRPPRLSELCGVWECLQSLTRAEDAALKRLADLDMQRIQLKDVAQEVRAERDVLQTRMSEQALRISSLSARLQQQRNDADALAHQATSDLSVQLHDALAEVQRLKEDLESKDKQLTRMKQNLEERDKLSDQHQPLYGNSCNAKDKVMILEKELSSAQTRIAQLEQLARSLETDKDQLQVHLRDHQRALAEKEDQLQELLALKLDDDNEKEDKSEVYEGKASARTLSDIVSISDFDEQDLQIRRAEMKAHNTSLTGAPFVNDIRDKTQLNRTLPPDVSKPNMSSLRIEYSDHFDLQNNTQTPRADSLPAHLTSTQNKHFIKQYKRNVNETTMFRSMDVKHSTAQKIHDNCSMYPNREVDHSRDNSVEPKKINFSLEPTLDNRNNDEEFTSLRELGITLDIRQENFPDILTQLKHEIKKSRSELDNCKSELKNAEEQLCEFPALKEEVEELKSLLENTMATMENDKKFYENQLENFSSNKKLLESRLTELTQEVNDKSKDLHLLKEDILRRENMILEFAKEKRNLTNKMTELEVKIDELQSRNTALEKCDSENHQLRDKVSELQKLEQLVSEKNQQIDSLNQHLDRLDDLQRCLNDKTEEFDHLKEALDEKSNELFQLQDTVEALKSDVTRLNEENDNLNSSNKELKLQLTKLEKEHENASIKLQSSETELGRLNSMNTEMTLKIEELKIMTQNLKDKETEIEILNEDINSFHEEIASLKEQLKMASRSPSPRSKSGDERRSGDRQLSGDKKQLVKIRKQISLLQHELDFNKKELNDQAFELARAKLDVTELKNSLSQASKLASDKDAANKELSQHNYNLQRQVTELVEEKNKLTQQMEFVVARMREESNVSELKAKLRQRAERCQELEAELQDLRDLVDRGMSPRPDSMALERSCNVRSRSRSRSPTAELERAVRDQLHYSHTLDEDIMDQILSGSSDEREDIPRLALNTSKSSSSIQSSSSERVQRLRSEKDKLQMQVNNLECRLKDKDALITELNRVRDKLTSDCQNSKLRYEAERDSCARLQLLLDTHKETAQSLQNQDSNMIQILKKRLESSMSSELELQQREQEHKARAALLQRQLLDATQTSKQDSTRDQLKYQMESNERLSGEISLLKSKLEVEQARREETCAMLRSDRERTYAELRAAQEQCNSLKGELAEIKRLKHDVSIELLRAKELLNTQSTTIVELERKLTSDNKHRPINDALTEIECHKSELAREISSLKRCLSETGSAELNSLRHEKQTLTARVHMLEGQLQARGTDDREQAIRYLNGRCLRLESCRKALVWQKRYLQRVLAGYATIERTLRLTHKNVEQKPSRFKSVSWCVVGMLRMQFLVRRRTHVRALVNTCILRPTDTHNQTYLSHQSVYTGTSPPSRDGPLPPGPDPGPAPSPGPAPAPSPGPATQGGTPCHSVARRLLKHELRLNLPHSPSVGEFARRSPFNNSPRAEPFILSSPRGEVAAAYLNKLELVSRCLSQAMDTSRDLP